MDKDVIIENLRPIIVQLIEWLKSENFLTYEIIQEHLPKIIEGNESLRTVFNFLNEERKLPYSGIENISFGGGISFESVCFSYNKMKLLENVSFSITPGEVVCITGPNGSGKSTIANLILGFYKPQSGIIKADSRDYKLIDLRDVRRSVGVVFQDTIIFPGTIRENIIYGAVNYSEKRR